MLRDLPSLEYDTKWIRPMVWRAPPYPRLLITPLVYSQEKTEEAAQYLGRAVQAGIIGNYLIAVSGLEEARVLLQIAQTHDYSWERCWPILRPIADAEVRRQHALAMIRESTRESDFDGDRLLVLDLVKRAKKLRRKILLVAGRLNHQHASTEVRLRQFFKRIGMLEGSKQANLRTMRDHDGGDDDAVANLICAVALNQPKLFSFKPFGEPECQMLLAYSNALPSPSKNLSS